MNKKLWFTIYTSVFLAIVTVVLGIIFFPKIESVVEDVFDDGKPKLIVEDVDCEAGQTIEVPIVLKNNPGTWGAQIIIDYDSNAFSFISTDVGKVYDSCSINAVEGDKSSTNSVVLILEHKKDFVNNKVQLVNSFEEGNVVVLKFMAKVGAKKGEHKITINPSTNFCDANAVLVDSIVYKEGIINID